MDWDALTFQRPLLTVLATDLVGSTRFLNACRPDEAAAFFREFGSLTREALDSVEPPSARTAHIANFVGDGYLTFLSEPDPNSLIKSGPARALIVAKRLRHEFRAFCRARSGGFRDEILAGLEHLSLVTAITHGFVLYGPFGGLPRLGNTGMLDTVVTAFRMTKIRPADQAVATTDAVLTKPGAVDYIVVCQESMTQISMVQENGRIDINNPRTRRPISQTVQTRLMEDLKGVTFSKCVWPLHGFGDVTFHEAVWPS